MEETSTRRGFLKLVAASASVGLGAAAMAGKVQDAHATPAEQTGRYTGNGGPLIDVQTGLASVKALRIFELSERGTSKQAYTSDAIQALRTGSSIIDAKFLLNPEPTETITFTGGAFTVKHPDFNRTGTVYAFEALGT